MKNNDAGGMIQKMKIDTDGIIQKMEIAAGGIVYKKEKSDQVVWLICKHSYHKGWVFPKGLIGDIHNSESIEEAALREVQEEGGVRAKIIRKIPGTVDYTYIFNNERISKKVHFFLMEYVSGNPDDHDWEMEDALFADEMKIRNLLTFENEKIIFEKAIKMVHQIKS